MPHSLSKDPKRHGAFLRRIQDIDRTLLLLDLDKEPDHIRFIMGYLACEKAAAIMQAMHEGKPSKVLDRPYKVSSDKLIKACRHLGFVIDNATIHAIFDEPPMPSARNIRNKFLHNMGPTHLSHCRRPDMTKLMNKFLGCIKAVEKWIERNGTT